MQGQDEEVEERTYLGSYNAHVVGVNHYRGMVSNGEMVRCWPSELVSIARTAWVAITVLQRSRLSGLSPVQ